MEPPFNYSIDEETDNENVVYIQSRALFSYKEELNHIFERNRIRLEVIIFKKLSQA